MMNNITINDLILLFQKELSTVYDKYEIDSIRFIAIEHLTGYTRSQQLLNTEGKLSTEQTNKLISLLNRLKEQEPIQYITGKTEFYELPLFVTPDVLIPRQETELLVDSIIKENKKRSIRILDIGTGSGCIAIALKKNLPQAEVTAIDISNEALSVAKKNSLHNNTEINFICSDIFNKALDLGKFDLVVSNPPYVMEKEKGKMEQNVLSHEPHLALFVPDTNALLYYKAISQFARKYLTANACLWVEINEALGEETMKVFREDGFTSCFLIPDLNGKDRFVKAVK